VLPVFGPSTFRDGVGRAVDVRFNLLNYIEPAARNPMYVMQFISARSDLLGATDLLKQAALDPYSFVRDAYLQQRKSLTYRGQSSAGVPSYNEPGEAGAVPGAVPAATPAAPGLPTYEDPGESGGTGGGAPNNAPAAPGLPQYDDPGADTATPASAPAAASATAPAGSTTAPAASGAPIAPAMPTVPASSPAAQ